MNTPKLYYTEKGDCDFAKQMISLLCTKQYAPQTIVYGAFVVFNVA